MTEKVVEKKVEMSEVKIPDHIKGVARDKLKKLITEETKLVRGIFKNYSNPGGPAPVEVLKYPGVPKFKKEMWDGCEYEIPLYVARFLNGIDASAENINGKLGTCSYPIHGFKAVNGQLAPSQLGFGGGGEAGIPVPIVGVARRVQRYGFQSMEFGSVA